MYKSAAILALAAGVVHAQSLPNIPACAIKCLGTAAPDAGCSGITDFECLCGSIDEIIQSSRECFTNECNSKELRSAQSAAMEFCATLVGSSSASGSVESSMTSAAADSSATPLTASSASSSTLMSSDTSTEASTMATTETDSDGNPTATRTEETTSTNTDGDGGDNGVGKPAAGLLAAGLAVLAAL